MDLMQSGYLLVQFDFWSLLNCVAEPDKFLFIVLILFLNFVALKKKKKRDHASKTMKPKPQQG